MSHNNNRLDDENYDLYEYTEFEMENGILTNTSSVSSNDGPFHNSYSTLSFAKSTSSHLSKFIQFSIPVRSLAESRREGWRSLDELSEQISELRENMRRLQSDLRNLTPRATFMGLESLERIVAEERVQHGYYGPVIDNIE